MLILLFRCALLPFTKHVRNRAFQPVNNLFDGVHGDVLLADLQALQGRVGNAQLAGVLSERFLPSFRPQEFAELFPEPVAHPGRMAARLSHIWDFVLVRRVAIR